MPIFFRYESKRNHAARIIEVLISTLVQKNVIPEKEANYIKEAGRGATYRQAQTGSEQTG